jgi:hypothetical protein
MMTIFELCQPRPDVLSGGIKESDFAADLALVLRGAAPTPTLASLRELSGSLASAT